MDTIPFYILTGLWGAFAAIVFYECKDDFRNLWCKVKNKLESNEKRYAPENEIVVVIDDYQVAVFKNNKRVLLVQHKGCTFKYLDRTYKISDPEDELILYGYEWDDNKWKLVHRST